LERLFSCYINNLYIVESVIRTNNQNIILYICNVCDFETKNNNKLTRYLDKYLIAREKKCRRESRSKIEIKNKLKNKKLYQLRDSLFKLR
jgi:dTDP-D-glucose 4,6-dehydratase